MAKKQILKITEKDYSFGFPESHTFRELDLMSEFENRGKIIFDHWHESLFKEEEIEVRLNQLSCD